MQNFRKDRAALENAIGYSFRDRTLLETALTHSSYSNESKGRGAIVECNERLEFLGDSVLSIIASEFLFFNFSDCPEGELTRMRAEIVCEKALAVLARNISLGEYLNLCLQMPLKRCLLLFLLTAAETRKPLHSFCFRYSVSNFHSWRSAAQQRISKRCCSSLCNRRAERSSNTVSSVRAVPTMISVLRSKRVSTAM